MGTPEQGKETFNKQEISEGLSEISTNAAGAIVRVFKSIDTKYKPEMNELMRKINQIIVEKGRTKFGIKE